MEARPATLTADASSPGVLATHPMDADPALLDEAERHEEEEHPLDEEMEPTTDESVEGGEEAVVDVIVEVEVEEVELPTAAQGAAGEPPAEEEQQGKFTFLF